MNPGAAFRYIYKRNTLDHGHESVNTFVGVVKQSVQLGNFILRSAYSLKINMKKYLI